MQTTASQCNASAPFARKWRLRSVSRAFHCAWHTRHAWRDTRWHLELRKEDYGQSGQGPSLAAKWTAPLQYIAHLLPDGFLDTIERACRPQFLKLPIDAALNEVRSFGAHVYVETLDMQPLPDEPFATHLLHKARDIGVKKEVRHATVHKRVALFQLLVSNHPFANAFIQRIFRPDAEAPARCSFANCNAPLDRRMPKARSIDIDVGASHLDALVECTSLCLCVAMYYAYV